MVEDAIGSVDVVGFGVKEAAGFGFRVKANLDLGLAAERNESKVASRDLRVWYQGMKQTNKSSVEPTHCSFALPAWPTPVLRVKLIKRALHSRLVADHNSAKTRWLRVRLDEVERGSSGWIGGRMLKAVKAMRGFLLSLCVRNERG